MKCSMPLARGRLRRWASEALDGDISPRKQQRVDTHLAGCDACRAWFDSAAGIGRRARLRQPALNSDVSEEVLGTHARIKRAVRASVAFTRVSLIAIGLVQIYLTLPDIFRSHLHEGHHIGVFDLALGVSMLYAAWRPVRAVGMIPFLLVLGTGLLITSGMDIRSGETPALAEAPHALVLLEMALIWHLQRFGVPRMRPAGTPSAVRPDTATALHSSNEPDASQVA